MEGVGRGGVGGRGAGRFVSLEVWLTVRVHRHMSFTKGGDIWSRASEERVRFKLEPKVRVTGPEGVLAGPGM